jgi:putative heme iron utilization protein
MDNDSRRLLRALLAQQPLAALATLHRGEPATSMVPFVLPPVTAPDAPLIYLHVSALATHTQDMQANPRVSLLVMGQPSDDVPAPAVPRVSLQADAERVDEADPRHASARAHYLARYPSAEVTFALADFSIVALRPVSARLIAGFGRADSLVGEPLHQWLRGK